MNRVEFEICSNIAYSSLLYCISIWLERQNIMQAKKSKLWDHCSSCIVSSCDLYEFPSTLMDLPFSMWGYD